MLVLTLNFSDNSNKFALDCSKQWMSLIYRVKQFMFNRRNIYRAFKEFYG